MLAYSIHFSYYSKLFCSIPSHQYYQSIFFGLGKQIIIKLNQTSCVASYFYFLRLRHFAVHLAFLLRQLIHRRKYVTKPKMTWFQCAMVIILN